MTAEYEDSTFTNLKVLALTRTKGTVVETFYAVVWKIERIDGTTPSDLEAYEGYEISDSGGVATTPITSICVAEATNKVGMAVSHTPIPGLLQVKFNASSVALVRLARNTNKTAVFPVCSHTQIESPVKTTCNSSVICPCSQVVVCEAACSPMRRGQRIAFRRGFR